MHRVALPRIGTATAWRDAARGLVAAGVPPEEVLWSCGSEAPELFAAAPLPEGSRHVTAPKSFVDMARIAAWHRDPERFARLYGLLWRLQTEKGLMGDRSDEDVSRLRRMEKEVMRCRHKMTAFVRFREIGDRDAQRRRFAAWFEPTHHTMELTAPFFARRFGDMDWLIATPDISARFEGGEIELIDGLPRPDLPEDANEALWTTYFSNIFNPARVKVGAMMSEMPKKYWKNMPETRAIPTLLAEAEARVRRMAEAAPTLPPVFARAIAARQEDRPMPELTDLQAFHREAAACTRCPLHANATQVVMGEGPVDAPLMIVGEQPGDQEDLAGRPFVGPAGQLFDRIAAEAGIDRRRAFVTNAVKHFKFTPRGKRRIHQSPNSGEISHCRWWLDAERVLVKPKLIVALGGTAAESLTGSRAGILKRRGTLEATGDGTPVFLTVHPSFLLRLPSEEARRDEEARFRADLAAAQGHLDDILAA